MGAIDATAEPPDPPAATALPPVALDFYFDDDVDALAERPSALLTAPLIDVALLSPPLLGPLWLLVAIADAENIFKRPGGQRQFSREGAIVPSGRSALQELQRWVIAHPAADHSITALAKRTELSPRHFARLFRGEVGVSPAAWVESIRIAAARQMLESGREAPKQVAARCGFADADTLRRAYSRHVGMTPAEYRKALCAGGALRLNAPPP